MIRPTPLSDAAMEDALRRLRAGGLVALPTETVYGLGADATDGLAVARIFEAKGRPSFNPLICHVASLPMAEGIAVLGPMARALAERFWPGPLTLVLPSSPTSPVHPLATAGLATVAVRMPRGIARALAGQLGRPIAAPSANRSGGVSPTAAAHVARSLGARVDLILDGGPAEIGLESTIVAVSNDDLTLLRPGGLPAEAIEAAAGRPLLRPPPNASIQAPGQLASHYAPHGRVRLDATAVQPGEWLIAFGPHPLANQSRAAGILNLSPSGDLREAAAALFAALFTLDSPDIARIAVVPIPHTGLGAAINNRLSRAAALR